MGDPHDRRAYRRSAIEVPLELSDLKGAVPGKTVDVSRGGLLASTAIPPGVGTLVRVRVLGADSHTVMAVGVVVRSPVMDPASVGVPGGGDSTAHGVAIALTSTSEAWDRFWEDVNTPGSGGDA